MPRACSINLQTKSSEQALVSIMDRGFLYGDGVYEVVRTYDGSRPFLFDRHFARLQYSSKRIALDIPFAKEEIYQHVQKLLLDANIDNAYVRLILTRGADERFSLSMPEVQQETLVIAVDPILALPQQAYTNGLRLDLVGVLRNGREAMDPNIKSGNYLNNILALREARANGYDDALMFNAEGFLTELSTSNIFLVDQQGTVHTPSIESGILAGITRGFLLEVCKKENIDVRESQINKEMLLQAKEVFLTSSTKEVVPVCALGQAWSVKRPGERTKFLAEHFAKHRAAWLQSDAI